MEKKAKTSNEFQEMVNSLFSDEEYFKTCSSMDKKDSYKQINVFDKNITLYLPTKNIYCKSDFEKLGELGKGAYAKVVKVKCLNDDSIKAIKIIEKDFMAKVL
jgi:hypothetical protein